MSRLAFEHTFQSPLASVWRFIADTERFNRAAGLPPVTYRDEPLPDGRSRRFGSTHKLGLDLEYEELPFEWIFEDHFSLVRLYAKGPIKQLRQVSSIRPGPGGAGCTVETIWEWEPRGPLTSLLASASVRQFGLEAFKRVYAELDQALEREAAAKVGPIPDLSGFGDRDTATDAERARIRAASPRVLELYDSPLVSRLEQALIEKGDRELRRMLPLAYAREWGAPRSETLNTFLAATRAGLLAMRWDVICPHCRGDKQNLARLEDVAERAFCAACNIDFDVDLDRALEAVFTPHPRVREVEQAKYCLGGPGTTPHVVAQLSLSPGESRSISARLAPGRYRLRATGTREYRWLDLGDSGLSTRFDVLDEVPAGPGRASGLDLGRGKRSSLVPRPSPQGAPAAAAGAPSDGITAHPVLALELANRSQRAVVVSLEHVAWATDTLSAGELVADQRFRDLFGTEVLAPGVKLAVGSATILFTDLVGSTAMYQRLGDAAAFGLVWAHFDVLRELVSANRGAIVKTIGDAIMAVFMRPEDALAAADALHRRVADHCRERGHEHPVVLKIGLHDGPCIAVTLNDRLDYFGSTVNLAARVEAQSQGADIVVSASAAERTEGAALLRQLGWSPEPIAAHCKGFAEPIPMLRFTRPRGGGGL